MIAEIGHNHQGSMEKCLEMIEAAARCGVDAVKLQKRHISSFYVRSFLSRPYESVNSYGHTYGEHRRNLELSDEQFLYAKNFAEKQGLTFLCTAFDQSTADFLAEIDIAAFKIASADIVNTPLLKHIAKKGKPILLSTGGATLDDVKRAYELTRSYKCDTALLQCTAEYPTKINNLNLNVIRMLGSIFQDSVIGLSSHHDGIDMELVAFGLGARIVEKHFTLDRTLKGTDQAFSLLPNQLASLVCNLRNAHLALGNEEKVPLPSENEALFKEGKKLVAARPISRGTKLVLDDIAVKAPNDGLSPYLLESIVGRTTLEDMDVDQPFSWIILL